MKPQSGSSSRQQRTRQSLTPAENETPSASFTLMRPSSTPYNNLPAPPVHSSGNRQGSSALPTISISSPRKGTPTQQHHSLPSTPVSTSSGNTADAWRSGLLSVEVRLRELVADGPSEPPSIPRIEEVLRLFDEFRAYAPSSTHAELFRLFRVELCRAIFSGVSGTGLSAMSAFQGSDAAQVPFFDKIDKMLRERNILQAELDAVEADHNVADLKRQIAKLSSLIPFYEQEVGRLSRENERLQDELLRVRQDLELTQNAHDRAFRNLEDEARKLSSENRELQLQVFRLSKDNREQLTGQSMYQHMKQQKADRLQEMFSQGSEAAGLQLLCHQLENSLNGIMNEFDIEYTKAIPSEMASLRSKINKKVALVLEEIHYCENRMEYLQGIENVKFMSMLRASTLYELEVNKGVASVRSGESSFHNPRGRSHSKSVMAPRAPNSGGGKPTSTAPSLQPFDAVPLTGPEEQPIDVQAKRLEWVKKFLGSAVEHRDILALAQPRNPMSANVSIRATTTRSGGPLDAVGDDEDKEKGDLFPYQTTQPGQFLQYLFSSPMLDITSSKFMIGIDVHAYAGGTTTHLRSINYLDPTNAIDLPARTTHVKLKFQNPMMRSTTVNVNEQLASEIQESTMSGAMEWSPQTVKAQQKGAQDGQQQQQRPAGPVTTSSAGSDPAHWRLYRKYFKQYRPYLPRVLDVNQIDFVMFQVCQRHVLRMAQRYELCLITAGQRSTNAQMTKVVAERIFRDEYDPLEFQISLVEVLESRYCFPELVAKGMYEVLTSLEALGSSAPQAQVYLDCVSGVISCCSTYITSGILHSLSSYWPVSLQHQDQVVESRDVMAVLRYIYPSESSVRVDLDHLISDLMLSCQDQITIRVTKSFLTHSIIQGDEGFTKKIRELLAYRAEIVQWSELEFADLFDICKGFVGDDAAANIISLFLESCCILGKSSRLPVTELAYLGATLVMTQSMKGKRTAG